MKIYKIGLNLGFSLVLFGITGESWASVCSWEEVVKGSGFEADVEIRLVSDQSAQVIQERSQGKLIVAGSGVFVWIVRDGTQRHLYHGDGKVLRYYYKSATASRYVRKGEPQSLTEVWVGYVDTLFWKGPRSQGHRFRMEQKALDQGCQTTWIPVSESSVLPPFSSGVLTWQNGVPPLVRDFKLREIGGRQIQLHFKRFHWGTAFPASQLKSLEFVLARIAN